jgi:predicted nuclease with TOPRIM domain
MAKLDIDRKVRQLDNDVHAIYEILERISGSQTEYGRRLDEVDVRFDGLETRFDGLDGKVDGLETRFDGLDGKVDRMDGKLDRVLDRLGLFAASDDD